MSYYIPAVYFGRGGEKSRGQERVLGDVLDEKFNYIGGREERIKDSTRNQKGVQEQVYFTRTYNEILRRENGESKTASEVYNYLESVLPDVSNMNPKILAVAWVVRSRLSYERDLDPILIPQKEFLAEVDKVWPTLATSLNAKYRSQKRQTVDIFRYIRMLDNHIIEAE